MQDAEGKQEKADKRGRCGAEQLGQPAARPPQDREIEEPAQQHPQQHKQPELAPAGDAAQKEEQHRRQQGIGNIEEDKPLFQPEGAEKGRQYLIEESQRHAAEKTQQGLEALAAGIDLHQPSSRPRKPRRRSFSPA